MPKRTVRFIAPDPDTHPEAIFDLTGKTFGRDGYWDWLRYCRGEYVAASHYDWKASTIGRRPDWGTSQFECRNVLY